MGIQAAFLQGKDLEHTVLVRAPKKPKSTKSGSYKNACNELANASRYWYLDIPAELCKLGDIPSKLDQGIFYFYNRKEIISIVSLSVHDLLLAGNLGLAQVIQKL